MYECNSFIYMMWLIHLYEWSWCDSFIYDAALLYVWMSHSNVLRGISRASVMRLLHTCDMTHSYLLHDFFICTGGISWASMLWLIYISPDSFTCVSWRISHIPAKNHQSVCDVTHPYMAWILCDVTHPYMAWILHINDSEDSVQWSLRFQHALICMKSIWHIEYVAVHVSWLIHTGEESLQTFLRFLIVSHPWSIIHPYVEHDSCVSMTYAWHDAFECVMWLIHIYWWEIVAKILEIIYCYSSLECDSSMCGTWPMRMYVVHMAWLFEFVIWLIHIHWRKIVAKILEILCCYSSMECDSSICGTWLIRVYDVRLA